MRILIVSSFLLAFTALFAAGCSDDGDGCLVGCAEGEACVDGACTPVGRACGDGCPTGQECLDNRCIVTSAQCSMVGEECNPSQEISEGFLCIDLDGLGPEGSTCLANCAVDGSCPSGSLCFFVDGPFDSSCEVDADCDDGLVCRGQQCRETVCRPSECEGYFVDDATCEALYGGVTGFENGAICADLGNSASYCYPGGPRQEGEACVSFAQGLNDQDLSNTCAPGLGCIDSICTPACETDDDCQGTDTCLLADDNFLGEGVGFCGEGCEPFGAEGCTSGTCLPIAPGSGICVDAGDTEVFEACVPGEAQCEEGTVCVQLQGESATAGVPLHARCLPLCDVTVGDGNSDGGAVGELEQALRDATCPNSAPSPAFLSFVNLSTVPVDIYLNNEMTPSLAGVAAGARADADGAASGTQYLSLDSGAQTYRVLPAGAPRTDSPLLEQTVSLNSATSTVVRLASKPAIADELGQFTGLASEPPTAIAQRSFVQFIHASEDLGAIDVIAVPTGDDLSVPANQTELAANLAFESITWLEVEAAVALDVLVFAAGADRSSALNVLLRIDNATFADGSTLSIGVGGTRDLGDLSDLSISQFEFAGPEPVAFTGPQFTCVDLDNGVFGYCQQTCGTGTAGYADDNCQGTSMGCQPAFVSGPETWANMCGPEGAQGEGDNCNPAANYGECGGGLFCKEYGNTAEGHDPSARGFCSRLCVEDDPTNPVLACAMGQACQPLDFGPDYQIGTCGFECTPDMSYGDAMCPAGLQACLPSATLVDDENSGGMVPPSAEMVGSYCSVSGDIASGQPCAASDCVPGTECIFPRSPQFDFLSSLFSPYVGGPGLQSTCTPQCDPFDGDSAPASCASGETCLFNFPLSAEVGHCAEITENYSPGAPCGNPGEACGPNSICLVNGDAPTCFEFCQYVGPDADGDFVQGGCSAGFVCTPLGNDVGVCLAP